MRVTINIIVKQDVTLHTKRWFSVKPCLKASFISVNSTVFGKKCRTTQELTDSQDLKYIKGKADGTGMDRHNRTSTDGPFLSVPKVAVVKLLGKLCMNFLPGNRDV